MKKSIYLLLSAVFLLSACKKNQSEFDPCGRSQIEQLSIDVMDNFTTLPSKVSVFFRVETVQGAPVAGLTPADFTVYEKGRNDDCEREISSFEANSVISSHQQLFYYNTILVLDLSASVTATSLFELKDAARRFIDEIMPANGDPAYFMGIWWFDGEDVLHELIAPTTNKENLKQAVSNITSDVSNDPSTDLYGAVIKSTEVAEAWLNEANQSEISSAVSVVIFTDGTDQAGRYLKGDALTAVSNADKNIRYFTIGLGEEIDPGVLNSIGKNGTVTATNQSELEETFRQVGQLIWAEANSYYLFEYCSPKRNGSGINDLRIEAQFDGKVGSATTKFDATGFTGGCQ
ncbi:MAG: hypothetical protein DHS20C18_44220 [Saprospiraceae bacterium]|nr:MAG: hypothetical protein DHS20C18_44220 [Saprospiraceae bacterium]